MEDQIFDSKKYLAPMALGLIFVTALLAVAYQILGLHTAALCDLIGVFGGIIMFGIMRYSHKLAAHWSLCVTYAVLVAITTLANPHAVWWLVLCPSMAVIFVGYITALIWAIIIVATIIGLGFSYGFLDILYGMPLDQNINAFLSLVTFFMGYCLLEFIRSSMTKNMVKTFFQNFKLASLGEMTGEIAHQVNNPLTVISTSTKMLQKELINTDNKKVLRLLNMLSVNSERISDLVRIMRTMTRDGQQDKPEITTIENILNDVIKISETRIKTSEVNFSYSVNKHFPIKVEVVLMQNVFLNLLNNALDFLTDEQHAFKNKFLKIELQVSKIGFVDVRIIDAGKGIPSKISKQIFQPFFTTKEVGKGTGLGLSFASKIVEQNGGKLFLDEKCDNTCFVIRLPIFKK